MFRLSSFRQSLLELYKARPDSIYPRQHYDHMISILESEGPGGLEDLSISRPRSRLSWGVEVPGDPSQTVYVWIDALTVYLSGIGYPWIDGRHVGQEIWPPNIQVIGKDILRCEGKLSSHAGCELTHLDSFHALYLPAMLQAIDLPLTERILSHAHWTVNQKIMSKSVGNVADPFEAIETFGIDVVRYYLARVGGRFRDDVGQPPSSCPVFLFSYCDPQIGLRIN